MIKAENLSKTFQVHKKEPGLIGSVKSLFIRRWIDKHALKSINLEIAQGEIVGFVGANGAGKTTLVKLLSGIIHPSAGTAKVLGYVPWERKNDFRRQIALIMGQKAQLWWDLPAADCFLLLREIYQIPMKMFHDNLDYLTHTLGVKEQLKVQIRRLSLGERMKMELIAALLHQPLVVYLDEPTIGLDLTAQRAMREFILRFRKDNNPAMILTSHYMEDIEQLCERIIIIKQGEIVYDGSLNRIVHEFARHKIITAVLRPGTEEHPEPVPAKFPANLGELVDYKPDFLKVKVLREMIPDAATMILQHYPVVDLNIEEEEIGNIIEAIIRVEQSE